MSSCNEPVRPGAVVVIPAQTLVYSKHPHRPQVTLSRSQRVQVVEAGDDFVRWRGMGGYLNEASRWEMVAPAPGQCDVEVADLQARLGMVIELHQARRRTHNGFTEIWCSECNQDWPCPTWRAATGPDDTDEGL